MGKEEGRGRREKHKRSERDVIISHEPKIWFHIQNQLTQK